jgi:hypothetical protein
MDGLLWGGGGLLFAVLGSGVLHILDGLMGRVSEPERILSAYRRAWDAWRAGSAPGTDEQLLEAMRNEGVPSSYSEPHSALVYMALECWRQRQNPDDVRRIL